MVRIIIILIMHVLADFFFQGSKLSKLKALKLPYLLEHVGIYTLIFLILSPLLLGLTFVQGVIFSLVNGVLHLVIDYFTGKFKAKYLETNESRYLTTIALDHTLHIVILLITYLYIFPEAISSAYLLN